MLKSSTITTAMKLAAQILGPHQNPDEWVGWITYILEALQDNATKGDYSEFLEKLQESISTRLAEGSW